MDKKTISFSLGPTGSVVLDPSFPRIAAKAALEIDGVLLRVQGKQAPVEIKIMAVKALLPFIKKIVDALRGHEPGAAINVSLDPVSANVFLRAYGKIDPAAGKGEALPAKFGEAANRVADVLEKISNKQGGPEESDLAYARDFCRALSDQAAVRQYASHAGNMQGMLRRLV
jgi:hypothetical protein